MSKTKTNHMIIKRIVDAVMTVLLLCLMAYQVTGEMAHEWIGMGMTVLVIIHQILNRKWYGALVRGKYNPYRSITTVLNILLIASFALTVFCGMSMSSYAVPFLYGMAPVSFVRRMHLSMSHWAFVLMGLHLGMHIPAITAGLKLKDRTRSILTCIFTCIGCVKCGYEGPCVQKDDVERIRKKLLASDMVVFATPLYYYGMSAQLKTVVDRFCAYNSSLNGRHLKSALLTVAWNADDWTFDALEVHYKTLVRYINFKDSGMVLGYGCGTPGMTKSSRYPQEAYLLGKSL